MKSKDLVGKNTYYVLYKDDDSASIEVIEVVYTGITDGPFRFVDAENHLYECSEEELGKDVFESKLIADAAAKL